MGDAADAALSGAMRRGMKGSGFPRGYMSDKRPCPLCEKPIAGRHIGMREHFKAKHGMKKIDAMRLARSLEKQKDNSRPK